MTDSLQSVLVTVVVTVRGVQIENRGVIRLTRFTGNLFRLIKVGVRGAGDDDHVDDGEGRGKSSYQVVDWISGNHGFDCLFLFRSGVGCRG